MRATDYLVRFPNKSVELHNAPCAPIVLVCLACIRLITCSAIALSARFSQPAPLRSTAYFTCPLISLLHLVRRARRYFLLSTGWIWHLFYDGFVTRLPLTWSHGLHNTFFDVLRCIIHCRSSTMRATDYLLQRAHGLDHVDGYWPTSSWPRASDYTRSRTHAIGFWARLLSRRCAHQLMITVYDGGFRRRERGTYYLGFIVTELLRVLGPRPYLLLYLWSAGCSVGLGWGRICLRTEPAVLPAVPAGRRVVC